MYAVIKTGGKQYQVQVDDILKIEKIDAKAGDTIILDQVLVLGEKSTQTIFGKPFIEGASVECKFIENKADKKILVFKMKRRKSYRRLKGHRQKQSLLKIIKINK